MAAFNNYGFNNPYMQTPPAYNGFSQTPYLNVPPVIQQAASTPQNEPLTNGGFIVVPNEEEIKRYPVAPGNFITFRLENQPVIVEKSLGRSQFDSPHYERYRLVKEDMAEENKVDNKDNPGSDYATMAEINEIKQSIDRVHKRIDKLKGIISKERAKLTKEEDDI